MKLSLQLFLFWSFVSFLGAKEIAVAPDGARTIVVNLVALVRVIQQR